MNVGETPMDQEGDEHANLNDHDEYPLSNFSSRANTFGATCPTVSPFAVGPSSAATLPNSVAHPPTPYRNGQTVATPSNAVIGAKKLIIRNFKRMYSYLFNSQRDVVSYVFIFSFILFL